MAMSSARAMESEGVGYVEDAIEEVGRLGNIAEALSSLIDVAEHSLSVQETIASRMKANGVVRHASAGSNEVVRKLRPKHRAARRTLQTLQVEVAGLQERLGAILARGCSSIEERVASIEGQVLGQESRIESGYQQLEREHCALLNALEAVEGEVRDAFGSACPGREHRDSVTLADNIGDGRPEQDKASGGDTEKLESRAVDDAGVSDKPAHKEEDRRIDGIVAELEHELLELLLSSPGQKTGTSECVPSRDEDSDGGRCAVHVPHKPAVDIDFTHESARVQASSAATSSVANDDNRCTIKAEDLASKHRELLAFDRAVTERAALQAVTLRNERSLIGSRYYDRLVQLLCDQRAEMSRLMAVKDEQEAQLTSLRRALKKERFIREQDTRGRQLALVE